MPSRTALFATTVGAFLVAGTAVAFLISDDLRATVSSAEFWTSSERGHGRCDDVDGRILAADAEERDARGARVLTYTLDAADLEGGRIRVCDAVGDVSIGPSGDDRVHVVIVVQPEERGTAEDVARADVGAAFAESRSGLDLVAWYANARDRDERVSVDIDVLVPETGAYAVDVDVGVGDVLITDLLTGDVDVASGVGGVAVAGIDATGDVAASSGVGDVEIELASVQTSSVTGETGVGDVEILVPSRPDVGYEASATTGVGSAVVEIGATESERREDAEYGPSESAYARSESFDSKPTQVQVDAEAGTGDAKIQAR